MLSCSSIFHVVIEGSLVACVRMNGQSSPNARTISRDEPGNVLVHHGFRIATRKLPILKAEPIEQMTKALGIAPPEMIFGDNVVSIEHLASGWSIEFTAFHALRKVDKTGNSMLQVAHSKEWQSTRFDSRTVERNIHAEGR